MSFLQENNQQNLAARITDKGRKKIAQGDFNISYFQIGDSEYDYGFSEFDGIYPIPGQKVLIPLDKDSQVKYPYKMSATDPTLTGVTYGTPVLSSYTDTITNNIGDAGFVYDTLTGSTLIVSLYDTMSITELDGTNNINISSGALLTSLSASTDNIYITVILSTLGEVGLIDGAITSFVYRVTGITGNTLYLDRNTPDLSSSLAPMTVTVISNEYYPYPHPTGPTLQQDSWTLNTIWSDDPAGLDPSRDEALSGYASNVFVSTKEYFGYNTSEQHSLALLRYPRDSAAQLDTDLAFTYEDYIDSTIDGSNYFELYIPFIYYDRVVSSTIGAKFHMGTMDCYINSSAIDTRNNQMKFRYLIDEDGNSVGKIFINHKVIIFDDQEIVAALDYKSNRRYTLPIPEISLVPTDSKCNVNGGNPLAPIGTTVYVTYLLAYTGDTGLTGMHCNYYPNVVGIGASNDVSIKFNHEDFQFMVTGLTNTPNGYVANKFYILAQSVTTGQQLDPSGWKIMDYTSEVDVVVDINGEYIDPKSLRDHRFIITMEDYNPIDPPYPPTYDLTSYLGPFPTQSDTPNVPEFGDEQPFAGCIKVMRATDVEVMRFLVNLPDNHFNVSQNPSFNPAKLLDPTLKSRITEVTLLDDNRDVMVIAKTPNPVVRTGTQVLAVKIDI